MEQRRTRTNAKKNSLQRTLIPLLVIAAILFVFLVIVENSGGQKDKEVKDPQISQTGELTPPANEEPNSPENEEPNPPANEEPAPPVTEEPTPPATDETEPTPPTEPDDQAPEISGVQNMLVYLGDTVSYRKGVTVTDNQDENPQLSIDSSQVDLSTEGSYEVVYTAEDAAGNSTSVSMTVTVLEKTESNVDLEKLNKDVDAVLAKIITEDMTTKQQVKAIYKWARNSLGYSNYDGNDWLKAAQHMLDKRTGDCFNYFAVCKLMFERLDIPNIDVKKVKKTSGASNHYWSLVSVDDGENYYHFDATPRKGDGDDFCLVTDDFIDKYSKAHNYSHNRDKSLYPATPKEALQ